MLRRILLIIFVVLIGVFTSFFLIEFNSVQRVLLAETFVLDAVYFENEGYVEITFLDKSQKTTSVVLEILGLPESFQKIFNKSEFTEHVPFSSPPKYGWESNPVTLVIEHEEFGQVGLKTEIHSQSEPSRPIIYSSP